MKKRVFALLLVLVLAASCFTACGSKDKKKVSSKSSYEDMYELLDTMSQVKSGTYEMSYDIDLGSMGIVSLSLTGKKDDKNNAAVSVAIDANVEGQKLNADVDDIFILKDGMAYINLAGAADAVSGIAGVEVTELIGDMELGYFGIPVPKMNIDEKVTKEYLGIGLDFLKAVLSDVDIKGEKKEFSFTLDDAESIKSIINSLADYVESDAADVLDKMSPTDVYDEDFDIGGYINDLIDYFYDDAVEVAEALGLDSAEIDEYVDQIKEMDFDELLADQIPEDKSYLDLMLEELNLDDADEAMTKYADSIRELADEMDEAEAEDFEVKTVVKATDDGFKASADITGKNPDDGSDITMSVSCKIVEEEVKIVAPKDQVKLGDFADIIGELAGDVIE